MVDPVDETLKGPDFFKCKHFGVKMRKAACVQRQLEYDRLYSEYSRGLSHTPQALEKVLSFEVCRDCEQGKNVRAEVMGIIVNPKRGEGDKKTDCQFYKDCLNHTAKKDWKTWKCNECSHYDGKEKTEPVKKENTRICETDGCERITLGPNCPYCPGCMARKSKEKREAQKQAPVKHKKKRITHSKPQGKKSLSCTDTAVTIDFGKHTSVLREVEKLAEEEMRPLNMQVVYMLSKQIEARKSVADHA